MLSWSPCHLACPAPGGHRGSICCPSPACPARKDTYQAPPSTSSTSLSSNACTSSSVTRGAGQKRDSQPLSQTHWIRICLLTRLLGDSVAHLKLRSTRHHRYPTYTSPFDCLPQHCQKQRLFALCVFFRACVHVYIFRVFTSP